MRSLFDRIKTHRFGLLVLIALILVSISIITRLALLFYSQGFQELGVFTILGVFLIGFIFDLVNASYFVVPTLFYLWICPEWIYKKPWHQYILLTLLFFITSLLIFISVSEWFFWDEFTTRFNFIAVDYLVYTTEVIGNVVQSYPIEWLVIAAFTLSALIVYFFRSWTNGNHSSELHFKQRTVWFLGIASLSLASYFTVNSKMHRFSNIETANELAGNGLYELFAAYVNNELDYDQFYRRMDQDNAFKTVRQLLKTKESSYVDSSLYSVERMIIAKGPQKKMNVILISVESFSAEFMGSFGNRENITPYLDSLAQHSLLYTNLYATGTRTVRGLEALSLCIPPTPGQSVVRRPHNEHLFSMGKVFEEKSYESKYIYGGYGYFDNMSYFFSNNSYDVVDRAELKDTEIDYENIWGVADENLFELATREIEKTIDNKKLVFAQIMTTSNHRPYTYPDGRIDIPSHTGRNGAVKYTDYAIGQFIKAISEKPWFENTMVVIVADHCASSAGKTELPVDKYHIPMLIYSPNFISPGKMDRLMSQIDIGPTILGLLNFTYNSKFYGYDMANLELGKERAFISTYQSLGYIRDHELVVLSPQKATKYYTFHEGEQIEHVYSDSTLLREAISWYQTASSSFKNGKMK